MLTNKRLFISTYVAGADIGANRLVMPGAEDNQVVNADGSKSVLGASTEVTSLRGAHCDVTLYGAAPVVYGATVVAGDRLKADVNGAAIPAAAGDAAVGIALVSGVAGDIGSVLLGR